LGDVPPPVRCNFRFFLFIAPDYSHGSKPLSSPKPLKWPKQFSQLIIFLQRPHKLGNESVPSRTSKRPLPNAPAASLQPIQSNVMCAGHMCSFLNLKNMLCGIKIILCVSFFWFMTLDFSIVFAVVLFEHDFVVDLLDAFEQQNVVRLDGEKGDAFGFFFVWKWRTRRENCTVRDTGSKRFANDAMERCRSHFLIKMFFEFHGNVFFRLKIWNLEFFF
jgi:hypothetical protein